MAGEGQGGQGKKKKKKRREGGGSRPYVSGPVQQFLAGRALPPIHPTVVGPAVPQGKKPELSLQMQPMMRQEMRLVMTPTLKFGTPEDIEATVKATLAKIRGASIS